MMTETRHHTRHQLENNLLRSGALDMYSHLPLFSASVIDANTTVKNCIATTRIRIWVFWFMWPVLYWMSKRGSLQPSHYQVTISYKHLWHEYHLNSTKLPENFIPCTHPRLGNYVEKCQLLVHLSYIKSKLWKMMYFSIDNFLQL